ncbi:MAG: hypothetical protein JNK04_21080, partial [Myxococcales bacterium]|nr:hypothetical protein [Myxococcales bacterium]
HREACGLIKALKDGADATITYDLTWTLSEIAKVHIDSPVGDRNVARQCAVEALRRLELIRSDKRVQDDPDLKVMEGSLHRFLASKSP